MAGNAKMGLKVTAECRMRLARYGPLHVQRANPNYPYIDVERHAPHVIQADRKPVLTAMAATFGGRQESTQKEQLVNFGGRMAALTESSRLRLRDALSRSSLVWRTALGMRDLALRGPWRSALIGFYRWRARARAPMPVCSPTMFPTLDVQEAVATLRARGVARGIQVPRAEVDELVQHFGTLTDEQLAEYREVHLKCAAADRIARDERLVSVARGYLGVEPILFRTVGWIRHPFKSEPCFHFDSADVKDLLVFIYLSDVDAKSHPHAVIPCTRRKSLRQLIDRTLPDAQAHRKYGAAIEVILGPRGTGFFEDTTLYHKRMAGTKTRLSLVIIYTMQRRP